MVKRLVGCAAIVAALVQPASGQVTRPPKPATRPATRPAATRPTFAPVTKQVWLKAVADAALAEISPVGQPEPDFHQLRPNASGRQRVVVPQERLRGGQQVLRPLLVAGYQDDVVSFLDGVSRDAVDTLHGDFYFGQAVARRFGSLDRQASVLLSNFRVETMVERELYVGAGVGLVRVGNVKQATGMITSLNLSNEVWIELLETSPSEAVAAFEAKVPRAQIEGFLLVAYTRALVLSGRAAEAEKLVSSFPAPAATKPGETMSKESFNYVMANHGLIRGHARQGQFGPSLAAVERVKIPAFRCFALQTIGAHAARMKDDASVKRVVTLLEAEDAKPASLFVEAVARAYRGDDKGAAALITSETFAEKYRPLAWGVLASLQAARHDPAAATATLGAALKAAQGKPEFRESVVLLLTGAADGIDALDRNLVAPADAYPPPIKLPEPK